MTVLERMFTRALRGSGAGLGNAAPGTGYTGSRRGSGPGSTNPGAGRGNTKNPVAGTRSITYNSPGQPLPLDIAADQLSQEDYLQSVYVMRCVRLIAETIAASPFVVGPNPFDPGNYDLDAPLARLLGPATPQAPGGPNPHLTSRAFWIWTIIQYITSGRWGWELQWDAQPEAARSNIIALWPLISIALAPIPIDGKTDIWAGFQYQTPTGFVQMTPQRVCYAWRPSIADWRMPESVLQSAHNAIYMQRALERYMVNLLKNNMVATTMVISPPFEESDQRRAWEDQFLAEYTGVDRAGGTIFGYVEHDEEDRADKPLVQVERIAQTAVEASLADLSRTAKDDICVLPGTGIVTKRGVVPVENVVVGDEVVTHQGRWRKVVATMVSQPSAPVVELRSPGLEPLSLTSNHPVYAAHYARTHADTAQQFQGHDWVAAGSLRAGRGHRKWHGLTVPALVEADGGHLDIAALHQLGRRGNFTLADADGVLSFGHRRANPIPSTLKLTPALGRLLGLYLAEGSTNGHQVTWYLHEDELDLQRQIHADTMEVFGLPVTVRPAAEGRCVRVTLSSSLAVPVFKSGNARTKAVPAWAWDGDADFMREVLWGWIQGDGSHDEKVSRGFTASRSLAWHMRLIAISLGHRASIRPVTQTASRIYGRDIAAGGLGWVVSWANRNEAAAGHGLIYRLEAGALSSPLRSVTALDYAGPVHNLSVEEDESYLTVGGMVHNCIALGVPRSLLGDACLKSDEWVRLADGSRRRAASLVGSTFEVLTSTPDGPRRREASAAWNAIEPCFEVVTESGRRLACNARHPLYAATRTRSRDYSGGSHKGPKVDVLGWTPLGELAAGNLLAVPTEFPVPDGLPYDLDEARVLGYLIGDGLCGSTPGSKHRQPISLAAEKDVHAVDFARSVEALGDSVRLYQTAGVAVYGVVGGAVRKLLGAEGLLGSRGADKHIPEGIWTAERAAQREFLSRLYAADGCASVDSPSRTHDGRGHRWYGSATITLSTISERLAADVQELLLRFGIASRIESQMASLGLAARRERIYHVQVSAAADVLRFSDEIGIFGKEAAVATCRALAEGQVGRGRTPAWRTKGLNPGLRWERIDRIEAVGTDATVMVSVPNGNTYLSTFWEHNSQRIYANSDAEYRNFWTITMLNLIAEIQDHVNLRLAPRIDPGAVGWFDLSKVVALQPPSIFAPPDVAEAINLGILSPQQAATLLNIPPPGTQGDTDVQTAPIGEELMAGIGMSGRADLGRRLEQWGFRSDFDTAPWVEVRQRVQMNSYLYREPWKRMGPKVELRPRIRAYEGVRQAELVRERTAGLRAVAMARATAQKVHRSLAKHYPDEVLDWVDGADWEGPTRVPLEDIDMARRPGGRDMGKVDSIAKAIAEDPDGPAAAPVVLVKTPSGSLKVADGYHRTLAHKRMGHKSVPAYVGTVDDDEGPWDREMHDAKLNRSASITVPTHELATRAMDVWYGTGGTAQLPPPRVVDVAEILNEAHPYVVESADHFNGIPNHVVDELAEKLNEAGALDEDDQPVTGVASTKVTQPTATVG